MALGHPLVAYLGRDVDSCEPRVVGPGRPLEGGDVAQRCTDRDDRIAVGEGRPCQVVAGLAGDHAQRVRVVLRDRTATTVGGEHGKVVGLGQHDESVMGARPVHTATREDDRPVGGRDAFGDHGDVVVCRRDPHPRHLIVTGAERGGRPVERLLQRALRQVKQDRARATGRGGPQATGHEVAGVRRVAQLQCGLRDRAVEGEHVDDVVGLTQFEIVGAQHLVPGEDQHRHAVLVGGAYPVHLPQCAWPDVGENHSDPAGGPSVAVGHVGGGLLLAGAYEGQPWFAGDRVGDVERGRADHAEDSLDAGVGEARDDRVRCGGHGCCSGIEVDLRGLVYLHGPAPTTPTLMRSMAAPSGCWQALATVVNATQYRTTWPTECPDLAGDARDARRRNSAPPPRAATRLRRIDISACR